MSKMKKEEVLAELEKINEYLQKCLWMEFTISESNWGRVEMIGAIDQAWNNYVDNYAIKLVFKLPYFISSLISWNADTTKPIIQLLDKKEVLKLKKWFRAGERYYVFKINTEFSGDPPGYVVAEGIECVILNKSPFGSFDESKD